MTKLESKSETKDSQSDKFIPTPTKCLSGASISGVLAVALYYLTSAIATSFAHTPLSTKNVFAIKIAIAVRTLVVGISALGTGIFAIVTLGLIALAIQLTMKKTPNQE
jgi:hypothetical protein